MLSAVELGDLKVAYHLSGSGPPLLLMHGAEGSHRMFDQIVPLLTPHFTVIAYDQRDCGDTQNSNSPSSLADLATDAKSLLLALGFARAHVYGTSFGGRVAQSLALRHPEMIDRLVLGSTWPLSHSLDEFNGVAVKEIQALRSRLPETAGTLAEYFFPLPFLVSHPHLREIFKNAQPDSDRSKRRFRTVNDSPSLDPGRLEAPTLLIAGELDRVVPYHVTLGMAELIPKSESVLLPGVGHAGAFQAAEHIANHIRRFCKASVELTPALPQSVKLP